MATLDDLCKVEIKLNTAVVSRATFGIPIVYGPAQFDGFVRSYSKMPDFGEDGLSDGVYGCLNDIFSQTPSPSIAKVGKASAELFNITYKTMTVGDILSVKDETLDLTYSVVVEQGALMADIMTELSDAINADATNKVISAVTSDNQIAVTYTNPEDTHIFSVSKNLTIGDYKIRLSSVLSDLDSIINEDPEFYGIVTPSQDKDVQMAIAEWTESHKKLFGISSTDQNIKLSTSKDDIVAKLRDKQYYRTFSMYHADATESPESAWMGVCFTMAPGTETWANKRLSGITPDRLSTTERTAIIGKNGNTIEFYSKNIALTNQGKVASGEWIDIIRGRDWLADLIQTNMAQMIINTNKIPYDDAGIVKCWANLNASLKKAVDVGFFAQEAITSNGNVVPSYICPLPRASEIDDAIKGSRILYLKFSARVAGAIHMTDITGSVGYSLGE